MTARTLVRDSGGNRQLDLGAGAMLAPNIEVRAESFGPLAHPLEPPMSGASSLAHYFRIDTDAIVADSQCKQALPVV